MINMDFNCISKRLAKWILGISVFIVIASISLLASLEKIYAATSKKGIVLEEGSPLTKVWEDLPFPIYQKLYFFNVTNGNAFLSGRAPQSVAEVGPYTYESKWTKYDLQWNSNKTVSYRERKTYQFVPEMSNGTEDDVIYTLNGPMIIVAEVVVDQTGFATFCINARETIIVQRSIRDLAFAGYDDDIIKDCKKQFNVDIPYKDEKFAWLYGKKDSNDGLFTVFTGADYVSKAGFINNWNGKDVLNFWNDTSCNNLEGTNVELGPPIEDHQDSYTFFQSSFCRSTAFKYTKDTEHFEIASKRFQPTYDLFANSSLNTNNKCFEVKKERLSGVLDISSCQFGAPLLISFPHFHLADPSYFDSVEGLNPSEQKHGSYIDVDPVTGLTTNLVLRFQMNVEIVDKGNDTFPLFFSVTKGVFPIYWVEHSFRISEDVANSIKNKKRHSKIIAYSVLCGSLIFGCLGLVFSLIVLRRSENSPYQTL